MKFNYVVRLTFDDLCFLTVERRKEMSFGTRYLWV